MAGYTMYRTLMDRWASVFKDSVPGNLRKKHRTDFMKWVIQRAWRVPGVSKTIEANVVLDEEAYVGEGCRVYFPESVALLEMLWRAKMDVTLEDLDLDQLPQAFVVAWPDCQIDGVELRGCLVSVVSNEERARVAKRFGRKYLGQPVMLCSDSEVPFEEVGIHVSYMGDNIKGPHTAPVYRCAIPNSFLRKCLSSTIDFATFLRGRRDDGQTWTYSLNLEDEEVKQQYVTTRLVIHMLVYMQACPDMVSEGFPQGHKAREYKSPHHGYVKPGILRVPPAMRGHASPSTHWRSSHFRSYPRRRDGTKKKGIVFVHGTVVNAEVDPRTVEAGA